MSHLSISTFLRCCFLLLLGLLFVRTEEVSAARLAENVKTIQGRVVWVNDGDTLIVRHADRRKWRVRLAGIDAPELNQPFGEQAHQAMIGLALDQEARLECRRKRDPYHRKICKVFVQPQSCPQCGQTLDVGMAMLTVGLAWWYQPGEKKQHPEDKGRYQFAEQEAHAKKIGLWQGVEPVKPWVWRKQNPVYQEKLN